MKTIEMYRYKIIDKINILQICEATEQFGPDIHIHDWFKGVAFVADRNNQYAITWEAINPTT